LGESDPILNGISLTPKQMSLLFDVDRIPPDKAHQLCVFCHHYSINTVRENEGMGQRNNAKDTRHCLQELKELEEPFLHQLATTG